MPYFNEVKAKFRYEATVQEALVLGREALSLAAFDDRDVILTEDFTDNDLDRYTAGVQTAGERSATAPWPYTSEHNITVYIMEDGTIDVVMTTHESEAAPTLMSTPTETEDTVIDLGVTTLDGETSVADEGTYVDSFNGLTLTRTNSGTSLEFSAANWEFVEVTTSSVDTVYKTIGATQSGVLNKISNTSVAISLNSRVTYSIRVKYYGGSTGQVYQIESASQGK